MGDILETGHARWRPRISPEAEMALRRAVGERYMFKVSGTSRRGIVDMIIRRWLEDGQPGLKEWKAYIDSEDAMLPLTKRKAIR